MIFCGNKKVWFNDFDSRLDISICFWWSDNVFNIDIYLYLCCDVYI
jgi:hypothetical protein